MDQATSQAPVPVLHAISGPRPRHPHHPVRPHADPLTHGLPYSLAQVGPCADHLPAPSTSTVPPRRPHCCVLHNYWRRRARAHAHEHDPLSTSTLVPSSTRLYTLISVLEEVVVFDRATSIRKAMADAAIHPTGRCRRFVESVSKSRIEKRG